MNLARARALILIGGVALVARTLKGAAGEPATQAAAQATITSDSLELKDNGAISIFLGHVILTDPPYVLRADRMVRTRDTGVVEVYGHVEGTWVSEKGEKIVATGNRGRYKPAAETIELWDQPKLMRWETAKDTAPVSVTAIYFVASRKEKTILAKKDVRMEQRPRMRTRSEFARYDQNDQVLHLWGEGRVFIHVEDAKGRGDFTSEKARVYFSPKAARLIDRVEGHVVPEKS